MPLADEVNDRIFNSVSMGCEVSGELKGIKKKFQVVRGLKGGAVFKDRFYPFDAPYDVRKELQRAMMEDLHDRTENAVREAERTLLELVPVVRNPRQATFTLGGIKYTLSRVKDGLSFVCEEPKSKGIYIPSEIPSSVPFGWSYYELEPK